MGLGFLGWIVLGLAAGAIAKAIMPGRQGGGFFATMLLGVVGALVGGFIGQAVGLGGNGFWSIGTWILAIIGTLVVLFIWGLITGRKAR
ncbi:GlsB/YeaQ/YmgE family stress response membrane protein [Rothia kristinae]|uniref:GlsB/YeaQ/YmgE family stress response membrane protein n=1 Tax=Rothia kristinae TaxID=37923 RepID=A0A7T4T4W9_9MICC|nr:GlsB/YeaQ/YmgE family stress response membrane protein [Rothia kristinae]MDN5640196.1 GlsB/YeaQ/YmgE family stress response membrane protein [Actinomycetes bacterium]QQC59929.1 GlsB/YeaQ/YmgE family stress response membrane protein [Rothia kristinae]